jgi:hypothetical protein
VGVMFGMGYVYLGHVYYAALELQYNGSIHLIDNLRAGALSIREVHRSLNHHLKKCAYDIHTFYFTIAPCTPVHTNPSPNLQPPSPAPEHTPLLTAPIVHFPFRSSIRTASRVDSARPSCLGRELVTCSVKRHGVRLNRPDARLG